MQYLALQSETTTWKGDEVKYGDRIIHEVLLGRCLHRQWSATSTSGRHWVEVQVTCDRCHAVVATQRFDDEWFYLNAPWDLDEAERRQHARRKMENVDWPTPGTQWKPESWSFRDSEAQGRELVRRLEPLGWRIVVRHSNGVHVCTLEKNAIRVVGSEADSFQEALFHAAVAAAQKLKPLWRA